MVDRLSFRIPQRVAGQVNLFAGAAFVLGGSIATVIEHLGGSTAELNPLMLMLIGITWISMGNVQMTLARVTGAQP